MDTIFALATAQGKSGVAIVRLSGPGAHVAARMLCGSLPADRSSAVREIRSSDQSLIDVGMVLSFTGPASFTGEDVVEFHLHGSNAVVEAVLDELSGFDGLRIAEPGEFTRRALENGRLDLTQVEGLADLIEAETESQRLQAVRVLNGALAIVVDQWRSKLIRAAALLEATIDFADEEVPVDVTPEVSALLQDVGDSLRKEVSGAFASERIRSGFEVAIVGPPNVGKSTLLNYLAGRDAAITSEVAGTTRDVIEVRMNLNGLAVTMLDTAGLRETDDVVEGIGISRAISRANSADLRVFLTDDPDQFGVSRQKDDIICVPKGDIAADKSGAVSGLTGLGVPELIDALTRVLSDRASQSSICIRARHKVAMEAALASVGRAQEILKSGPDLYDIASEELRASIRDLELMVGRIDVENLLDEIFSSFCVGK